jgi:subtilisin family serine protease
VAVAFGSKGRRGANRRRGGLLGGLQSRGGDRDDERRARASHRAGRDRADHGSAPPGHALATNRGWGGDGFRALPGELLVGYRSGTPEATKDGIAAAIGARRAGGIGPLNVEILDLSDERIDHVARLLRSDPSVAFVERDPVAHAAETTPNDPYWPEQWGPVRTRTNLAWDATTGSSEVVIAIIDSGVNPVADLGGKVLSGYDYVGRDSDPADENGHGTKAAGVAAAVGSNSEGVAGYCWGCRILPVRVLDSTGYGSYSNIASGIT